MLYTNTLREAASTREMLTRMYWVRALTLTMNTHTTHCITKALGNVSISSVVVSCTPPPGPCTSHSVPPLWPVCWSLCSSHVVCSAWKEPGRPQTVQQELMILTSLHKENFNCINLMLIGRTKPRKAIIIPITSPFILSGDWAITNS